MASKRMISKSIIESDNFLEMPTTAQLLYFHLLLRGDDEGFVNNPKSIMRNVRCTEDDMRILIAKQYIIPFESGIVVIKHWKIHNCIRKSRLKPTECVEEKALLSLGKNEVYELTDKCQPNVSQLTDKCQASIDKNSIDKNNILSSKLDHASPVVKEVVDYLNEKTKKSYKASTSKTKTLINTRINEGYSLDDFKKVIDTKTSQWLGTDMEKYLRPETLFGTHFEGYLQEQKKEEAPVTQKKKIVYEDELMEADPWI